MSRFEQSSGAFGFGRRRKAPVAVPSGDSSRQGVGAAVAKTAGDRSSSRAGTGAGPGGAQRVEWFDYAKGICIVLVVMMHSTLGVGEAFAARGLEAEGFMHWVVAFAKPFRMPDFFLLSGLFLAFAINRTWLHYLDKKLVHFVYFYLLWMAIQVPVRAAATGDVSPAGMAQAFVDGLLTPYATLWFIYILPVMFILTKLLRGVPAVILLPLAAAWQMLPGVTNVETIDHQLAPYFVFFLAGYFLQPHIFNLAEWADENPQMAGCVIAAWAILTGALVTTPSPFAGFATVAALPVVLLLLGAAGAMAIVCVASLLARYGVANILRICGRHSIVIYVSFTIPMAITRMVLMKVGVIEDVGVVSMIVWLTAVAAPLALYFAVRKTPLGFLYARPSWFALSYRSSRRPAASGGEVVSAG